MPQQREDRRSYLFVPGDRPDRFAKAAQSGAERIILDLEDAVGAAHKVSARASVAQWLARGGGGLIRINGTDTPWFEDDVAMALSSPMDGLILPKASAASVTALSRVIQSKSQAIALIESVAGIVEIHAVASNPVICRLAFGSVDFALDSGIASDGEEVNAVRTELTIASRYAGLPAPIDGVSTTLNDPEAIALDVARARRFGFGGKLAIHPRQIAAIHQGFLPLNSEIAWAREVLGALAASGDGVIAHAGEMLDKPVIERARRIVAISDGFGH